MIARFGWLLVAKVIIICPGTNIIERKKTNLLSGHLRAAGLEFYFNR